MRKAFVIVSVFLFSLIGMNSGAYAQHMEHHPAPGAAGASVVEPQDWAKARLAKSPRHQEWVKIKNGNREVSAFVVYPEVKKKATAVIVIHEINGMTDWVQSLTDQLAEAGYVAIAPDFLSGMGPDGGGTSSFTERNAVGQAIRDLPPDQITADLNAVAAYVTKLPASNGKVAVSGFCWGGAQSFRYATNNPKLKAAFVFYGMPPMKEQEMDKEALARIKAPVHGFYAGNDARINGTLPKTIEAMKALKKKFEPVTYEGAGHGFMRSGEGPEPEQLKIRGGAGSDEKAAEAYQRSMTAYKANQKAREESWTRWKKILTAL